MFSCLQSRIRGTASVGPGTPPPGLMRFYWHFARQTTRWYGSGTDDAPVVTRA